jgi:hypothetical protein
VSREKSKGLVDDGKKLDEKKKKSDNSGSEKKISLFNKNIIKKGCKQVYDKANYCVFCGHCIKSKISRHLLNVHKEERDVLEIRILPKRSKERMLRLQKLANDGNFKHNTDVLQKGSGNIVVSRRSKDNSNAPTKFLPCEFCNKFISCDGLWRHYKICPSRQLRPVQTDSTNKPDEGTKQRILAVKSARAVLSSAVCNEDEALLQELLNRMRDDEMKGVVMHDRLLKRYALLSLESLGRKADQKLTDINRVSSCVRTLAKLVIEARSYKPNCSLESLLTAANFDLIIGVTRSLSTEKEKPALNVGKMIGHLLNHAALVKSGLALKDGDDEKNKEATDFRKLHKAEWTYRINSAATKRINNEKRQNTQVIPLTEDLQKLRNYVLCGEVQVADIMIKPMPKPRFQKLRKVLGLDILADID